MGGAGQVQGNCRGGGQAAEPDCRGGGAQPGPAPVAGGDRPRDILLSAAHLKHPLSLVVGIKAACRCSAGTMRCLCASYEAGQADRISPGEPCRLQLDVAVDVAGGRAADPDRPGVIAGNMDPPEAPERRPLARHIRSGHPAGAQQPAG